MGRWSFVLLTCLCGAAYAALSFSTPEPYTYEYRAGEVYIAFAYDVTNVGRASQYNSVRWIIVSDNGRQIEDGFHPIIEHRFCQEHGCNAKDRASATSANRDVMPGATIQAIAVFGELDHAPATFRLMGKQIGGGIAYDLDCQLLGTTSYRCAIRSATKRGTKKR